MDREENELRSRINEIEKQLRLRTMSAKQAENIREMLAKIKTGLDNLDFKGRQSLVRMLIDRVVIDGMSVEIQTVIPFNGQSCPTPRGDEGGEVKSARYELNDSQKRPDNL